MAFCLTGLLEIQGKIKLSRVKEQEKLQEGERQLRKINNRTRTPRGNTQSTQFSVLPKFEISKETTLYTGETGIQEFLRLHRALLNAPQFTLTLL